MLTADPHCADIAATQHDCGAITVAASEGGRPAAAAVRLATSGVEGGGRRCRVHDEGKRRAAPGVHGRVRRRRGGGEEGGEEGGEGDALA